jgi:flagellin
VRINTNANAINVQRNLNSVNGSLSKSIEKLSSGLRINRAGDDAAGLYVSEKLRGQTKGLNQAVRNAQDGISMIQTAEGGLNETHNILQRMRELAVQGANDTLTDTDRGAIASELTSLRVEIDRIATNTEFNTKKLLNGSMATTQSVASAGTDLLSGEVLSSSGIAVSVNVSGAQAGTTYSLSNSNSTGVTITATVGGATVSQTVVVNSMTTASTGSQTLNFNTLGITITLSGSGVNASAGVISNDFANAINDNIVTIASTSSANFQVGANANQTVTVSIDSSQTNATNASAAGAFGAGGGFTNLQAAVSTFATTSTSGNAQALILSLDDAIADISMNRSNLGAVQNRLEHTIENLATMSENLTASESRIRDADMALEMVQFTRNNILSQAGTSILAQANQLPQGVLSLLR